MIDRPFRLCAAAILISTFFYAQAQVITTVAGTDFAFPATPLAAVNAPAGTIGNVAVDASGNLYFTEPDIGNNLVFKVDRQGTLTVVAGNGTIGFSGDGGPATSAALDSPVGIAVDPDGNVFIADTFNHRIRKVTPDGIITTVAGNGSPGYSGDGGLGTNAKLNMGGNGALADGSGGQSLHRGSKQQCDPWTDSFRLHLYCRGQWEQRLLRRWRSVHERVIELERLRRRSGGCIRESVYR